MDAFPEEDKQPASASSPPGAGHRPDQAEIAAPTPPPRPQEEARPGWRGLSLQSIQQGGSLACPQCQHENDATASVCAACGAHLAKICPACGRAENWRMRFCTTCGTLLTESLPILEAAASAPLRDFRGMLRGSDNPISAGQGEPEAERRQLTVLFCDLVDSTPLSTHLDPEELREVVQAYHAVCAEVIERFDGHIAQYLGDGLLVYFGYPRAHEDDAQRAVRVGLGIVEALGPLQKRLQQEPGVNLNVRVGIHTGLVVVGSMGEGLKHEHLAMGEAPNLAARLQGIAPPDSVLISATTARLIQGWFVYEALGEQTLKGFARPISVYRALQETGVQNRLDMVSSSGLTPLVGREHEVGLLLERWKQAQDGLGQIVLLSGEAGIGKSRLLRAVQDGLAGEAYTRLECRCSPYTQHSALYPIINLGRRLIQWQRDETPEVTLRNLEHALASYDLSLPEVLPLLASLLSLPPSERYPTPQLTPQRQKQKTLEAILALVRAQAAQQPVLFIVEDLHWVDPSTLELLTLLIDQEPSDRILTLLTARPEFHPPWHLGAHVTSLTLERLSSMQVEQMIDRVTGGKRLPAEIRQQVVVKTDGVPLFVEELTKMVLESGLLSEQAGHYELRGALPALAIPTTLHDSLMARLDRLGDAKEVAQLGAALGRTFPYDLLRAVSPWDEGRLQHALAQLVEAELLYQRGVPPHLAYVFKHALIQETAYQSLLRSKRQQYHRQTVHTLEQHFSEIAATQPELLAYHYTEAGLAAQAVPYWQRAGQRAVERSANVEAISHFTKGLELLKTLPETLERIQQELTMQLAIGAPLLLIKGVTAPEVAHAYARAQELCQEVGNSPERFSAFIGLWRFHFSQARLLIARALAEQCFTLAQHLHDPVSLQEAHMALGSTFIHLGEWFSAHVHLEEAIALYDPSLCRLRAFSRGTDPGVVCLSRGAWTLWMLGYADQALTMSHKALSLAQELSHASSLAFALFFAAVLRQCRREARHVQEQAEAMLALSREHGFVQWIAGGVLLRGWALTQQGMVEEGITQIQAGHSAWLADGNELGKTQILARLAEAYGKVGRAEEGLHVLAGAFTALSTNAERHYEAELYRLQGDLLLQQAPVQQPPRTTVIAGAGTAERHFCQAIDVARRQHAKFQELRAVMSLSRLWQTQGKSTEACALLEKTYGWFTEGFETSDLRSARTLLEALRASERHSM